MLKYLLILFLIVGCSETTVVEQKNNTCPNDVSERCDQYPKMTNQEIIRETKACEDSGLGAEGIMCGEDVLFFKIQCKPK